MILKHNKKMENKEESQRKKVRFIPCSERVQTFNWQLTNKKARYIDPTLDLNKRETREYLKYKKK
jgi:hypothetical protein